MFIQRKPNRLKEYDYSESGYYFITICTLGDDHIFGKIQDKKSILNEFGNTVTQVLKEIPKWSRFIYLDSFVIMPDHIHLLFFIDEQNKNFNRRNLSFIIGTFKSIVSKKIHLMGKKNFKWERSFYDRIIKNDKELQNIKKYIEDNPLKAIKK